MRVEIRKFGLRDEIKHLLLFPEDDLESDLIDRVLGGRDFPIALKGECTLSDGSGEHYIRLLRADAAT